MVAVTRWTAGVLTCYEVESADLAAELAEAGARWLIHPTSDRWQAFDVAARQHLNVARARSAEVGLPLLRVSNVRDTTYVDWHGRWRRLLGDAVTPAATVVQLALDGNPTFVGQNHRLAEQLRVGGSLSILLAGALLSHRRRGRNEQVDCASNA